MHVLASSASPGQTGAVWLGGIALVVAYFTPTIIAICRRNALAQINVGAVISINFLLGWTVIFWIIAFVMSLRANPRMTPPHSWGYDSRRDQPGQRR